MTTNDLDRAIKIATQIRIELMKLGQESLEELAYTMEILMCKTHDQISSLNSGSELGDSGVTDEHVALHDVANRTAHGSETKTPVERPLPSMPETESFLAWIKDEHIELHNLIEIAHKDYLTRETEGS